MMPIGESSNNAASSNVDRVHTIYNTKSGNGQEETPASTGKHTRLGEVKKLNNDKPSPFFRYYGNQIIAVNDDSIYGVLNRLWTKFEEGGNQPLILTLKPE